MRPPNLTSTAQYIAWYARQTPDATAIAEPGASYNYRRLAGDIAHWARALDRFGVTAGMLVGVETPERYNQMVLLVACEVAGATTMSLRPEEMSPDAAPWRQCDVILTRSVTPVGAVPRMIALPADWPADDYTTENLAVLDRPVPPDQVVRIVKTSGTTGQPKAMPMTAATQQLRIVRVMQRVAATVLPHPRFMCLYPIAVNANYLRALGVLQHGGTVLFSVAQHTRGLIAGGRVNYAIFPVGDAERLIQDAEPSPLDTGMTMEVFGAAVSVELRRQIRERLNAEVSNLYASNETSLIAIVGDDNIGALCAGVELRIRDEYGRDQPQGTIGQIWVRTETTVQGYFADPTLTAASFVDGWFRTGDLGQVPSTGKVIVIGRADDMLNIGGVKVARLPLEAQLQRIDGITDAVAASIPNRNGVGVLRVAVETDHLSAELSRQVEAVLSTKATAFEITPLPWFPRSDSGKVLRSAIEALMREREAAVIVAPAV